MSDYDSSERRAPALSGRSLAALARAIEHPLLGPALAKKLLADAGVTAALATPYADPPSASPIWPRPNASATPIDAAFLSHPPAAPAPRLPLARARDYAAAYRSSATSPEVVAERVLAAIAEADRGERPLRAFISVDPADVRAQAALASARIASGRALSLLDGVPIAVKDEIDQVPYSTSGGTSFLGRAPVQHDATVVARLRECGALLIGKTNMHEIGIQPNGSNLHHGQVRNPFDLTRDSGGSSSGSAVAVAAGLCPIAIGADGGGSVRIPAALCGVVGLKATYGRISEAGALPLCWSVAHIGPIAASVEDAALAYAAIAGRDPRDSNSLVQPEPSLQGFERGDLAGVRIGVFRAWFEHAQPEIVKACDAALEQLVALGASVQEVTIPELTPLRVAHNVTIGYDADRLPIGLQLTGRAWDEALLLRAGRLLEAQIARQRPRVCFDLLAHEKR